MLRVLEKNGAPDAGPQKERDKKKQPELIPWQLVLVCLAITWAEAQNGRGPQHQDHNGHGWDIRLAVPGEPGSDYPTLGAIPRTSFSCAGREPGYYADLEANCQVFRVCTVGSTYGFQSFLCPNGTLFNQAVFVCDWWMNVDCQNSQQFFNNNNEQFENLRLGPQLMKDIKKMLTHPMLNPYDKNAMKSNLIVMQDYKPPFGQLFPNGALLAGPERAPNNVFVPAKQIQQNLIQGNSNDYAFSASTPDPRYIPASINSNFLPVQRESEVFQRQRQNGQNARVQTTQNSQSGNLISNGHAGRLTQNGNTNFNGFSQAQVQTPRPTQFTNNFSQRQFISFPSTSQTINAQNNQRGQNNKQRSQYSEPRRLPQTNNEIQFARTQNTQNNNPDKQQQYTYSTPAPSQQQYPSNLNNPAGKELKENLVSVIKDIPSTVITKTLTYSRLIQEPKVGKPKSRITVKTWIVKPTKSARLIAEPTPYTYARPSGSPSPSPTARLIEENTPYVYDVPTTSSQTETAASPELNSEQESEEPYVYTRPTPSAKQVQTTEIQTTRIFIAPTTLPTRASFLGRISNFPQTSPLPTKASRLYLTPSPFTSTARFYLPPSRNPTTLPRLYLPQNVPQPIYYQNAQLRAVPTIPTPTPGSFNENLNQPSFSVTKQSRTNANIKNLTFTDILTKEKLDITVNDIVKDTDDILKTASPPQYSNFQNHKEFKSLDFPENYSASKPTIDSGETLTSQVPIQSPTVSTKSFRIIATPATSLLPPNNNFIYQNSNHLPSSPFFKETGIPNTIERTVSIKITIPERIAAFLFKNRSDSDFDKLEILNTGNSNYLVMSNNFVPKKNAFNFIPIAKLIGNQNSNNLSDSQALVYSFLTDSINVAREYNNIAQRDIESSTASPAPAQFQNLNNEKLSQITNQISQLTSSQYSSNNPNSFSPNINIIASQRAIANRPIQFTGNAKYINGGNQAPQAQLNHITPSQQTQGNFYSSRFQIPNIQQSLLNNQNQLYSGQLYQWSVPDVTNYVYNIPSPAKLVNPSNIQQQTTHMFSVQQNSNQNNADNFKQSHPQFEVVKAETVALNPAKLQLEPPNEGEQFASQENLNSFLNSENGISAQVEDKIVGTIPHPLEDNKVLTYKKDQSYYLFTKLEDNTIEQNSPSNQQTDTNTPQNAKLLQSSDNNAMPKNLVSFQLIPSVSYELEDEKDQEKFLSAFQIDEFGAPRDVTTPQIGDNQNQNQGQQIMTSSVDFTVEHPTTAKQNEQFRVNQLYSGPSSYTAPQSSIGSLGSARQVAQNNVNSKLEDFDSSNNNGYPQERPARKFFPTYRYN